jgi:Tol biopolymer transport system component
MWRILLSFVFQLFLLALSAVAHAQTISHVRMAPMDVTPGQPSQVYVTMTETAAEDVLIRIFSQEYGVTYPNKLTVRKGRKVAALTIKTDVFRFDGASLRFTAPGNVITKILRRDEYTDGLRHSLERVSAGPAYEAGNAPSDEPEDQPAGDRRPISADGQRLVFSSRATNLVIGDTNRKSDVFLRDAILGRTIRLSNGLNGKPANGRSFHPSISADGAYAVFVSEATNLVPNDTNSSADVFLVRISDLSITRVSITPFALEGNDDSGQPSISADGSCVAFASYASNLVLDDTNGFADVYAWSRVGGTIARASLSRTGGETNGDSYAPSVGEDGTKISFTSKATNLTVNDLNELPDIFLRDRTLKTNTLVSVDEKGLPLKSECTTSALADNGNRIAFSAQELGTQYWFKGSVLRVWDKPTRKTRTLRPKWETLAYGSFALSESGRYLAALEVTTDNTHLPIWSPYGATRYFDLHWSGVIGMPFDTAPRELSSWNFFSPHHFAPGISATGEWTVLSALEPYDDQDANKAADIFVLKAIYPVGNFDYRHQPLLKGESTDGRVILNLPAPVGGTTVTLNGYGWVGGDRTVVVPEGQIVSAPVPFTVLDDNSWNYNFVVTTTINERKRGAATWVRPFLAYSDKAEYPKGTKYVRAWVELRTDSTTDRSFAAEYRPPVGATMSGPASVVVKAGQRKASFVITVGGEADAASTVFLRDSAQESQSVRFNVLR